MTTIKPQVHVIRRAQMRVSSMSSLALTFFIYLIVALTQNISDGREFTLRRTSWPKQNLKDPMVWDISSLYKLASDSEHTNRISHRSRRSAPASIESSHAKQQAFVDACQSKMEVLTPYYATNSKGKLRTIVNSELMQQAIQVETCVRSSTNQSGSKCSAQLDCGCEQKYKWHRLLVLDPKDLSSNRGLFMDWFLFPSACVCRCKSSSDSKLFLRAIKG